MYTHLYIVYDTQKKDMYTVYIERDTNMQIEIEGEWERESIENYLFHVFHDWFDFLQFKTIMIDGFALCSISSDFTFIYHIHLDFYNPDLVKQTLIW